MANEKNGIDSIYDPSDVSRILAQLKIRRLEMEEDEDERLRNRSRKIQAGTKIGTSAYKMWSDREALKTAELLKNSPVMKVYTKGEGTIEKLESMGRLIRK